MKTLKRILYGFGIIMIFATEVVSCYEWFDKKSSDWYTLFIIIVAFFSTCIMVAKIIKGRDLLERIRNIMYSKNMNDKSKLNAIEFQMFDIDAYLNDK